jgi:ribosomal protein S25
MKAPLTSEQIARLLGGVAVKPVAPAPAKRKRKRRTTVTPSMAAEIRKTYAKNSTYTWAELGKRFGLSKSAARSVIINERSPNPKH